MPPGDRRNAGLFAPHYSRDFPQFSTCVLKGRANLDELARERWTMSDEYRFGIEEEYFLVDAETKSVAREMPDSFLTQLKAITGGQVRGEMLQSQLEVASAPHTNIADARTELRFLRQTVSNIGADHGLAILAVGTHPTATWRTSVQTPAERYDNVMEDLQMIGQRNMLCGLHLHFFF